MECETAKSSFLKGYPIDLTQVIVVPKQSKLDYDLEKHQLSLHALLEMYNSNGIDGEKIISSHRRQQHALSLLIESLPNARFITRSDVINSPTPFLGASLVIAFGGDNHFQFVSDKIKDKTPILGINSDPNRSYGAMLAATCDQIPQTVELLRRGDFIIDRWSRITVNSNGVTLGTAISEVFAGELESLTMSRHLLERKSIDSDRCFGPLEQKSSGILIATGSGSTGWFRSASRSTPFRDLTFSANLRELRFVAREPSGSVVIDGHRDPNSAYDNAFGDVREGETLKVHSLNDDNGCVALDSLERFSFSRGQEVEISLDEQPLFSIKPNY